MACPAAWRCRASLQSAAVSGDRITLEVQEREQLGSRHARRLRARGVIPGVLYGNGSPRPIAVSERALRGAMTGPSGLHAILDVVLEGQKTVHPSILADYQQDPVRGTIAHIDLREVRLDQPIQASVVVHLVGEAQGAQEGGVVSLVQRELNVEALPMDVPDHIDVDISQMQIGDVLRLEDVRAPQGVTFLDDLHETVIVTVVMSRAFQELEEAEAEAAAEAEAEAAAEAGEELEEGEEAPTAEAETATGEEAAESDEE
jgi:large subunit ribosomal protein L25